MTGRYVYFMKPVGRDGPIKIGCSHVPTTRLDALSVWSPYPLEIVATIPGGHDLERNIHECFADDYSHKEWFRASKALVAFVSGLRAGRPLSELIDLTKRKPIPALRLVRSDPEWKLLTSYSHRLNWAERRLLNSTHYFDLPDDVKMIMARWRGRGYGYSGETVRPSEAEFARLDALIADPIAHLVAHSRQGRFVQVELQGQIG